MNAKTVLSILMFVLLGVAVAVFSVSNKSEKITKGILVDVISYACDKDKSIEAEYYENSASTTSATAGMPSIPGQSVKLTLSDGRKMTLDRTISADGVRYANQSDDFVFWSKGNGALVLENNQQKSYIGCVIVSPKPADSTLDRVYSNSSMGFSIRLPGQSATSTDTFKAEEYSYKGLGPNKEIYGIKFTIPQSFSHGTNLSPNTYLSVESIPREGQCDASKFLSRADNIIGINDAGILYSVATSSDPAAGSRYEETVYALPDSNPCLAVRYFVRYGVIDNYPRGEVEPFNRKALLYIFDTVRRTLVVNQ